jgi:hypothetical protein
MAATVLLIYREVLFLEQYWYDLQSRSLGELFYQHSNRTLRLDISIQYRNLASDNDTT